MASSRHKPHPGRRTTKATAPAPPPAEICDASTSLAVTLSPTLATGRDVTGSAPSVMGWREVERKSWEDKAEGTVATAADAPAVLDVLMARAVGAEVAARALAEARRAVTAAPVARRVRGAATVAAMIAIVLCDAILQCELVMQRVKRSG